ncbi:MAG: hypothetical protein DI565_18495 [Ancylobacter novellus]|uniref:Flp family type IVb pilin n=1 Tax=Ancylobacter novellus TaxID=921 RepID=A0A2W5K6Q1_ANCNO|nr:MAG: hypothetical protein DI565_18495 [Ancylobacter novellus]
MSDITAPATGFRRLLRFVRDERGATAIEYAIIAVGVACAVAATIYGVGTSLKTNFYEPVENATKN